MGHIINIYSMNGDRRNFRNYLHFVKENSNSVYCESPLYGDIYRIEKKTGKVFCNGKQIADTSEWEKI